MSDALLELDEGGLTLHDYLAIVKRRRYYLVIPAVIVAAAALVIIFSLTPTYRSQATILIEEQEVPREFVVSTISSFAAQQIQVISQRVLTAESIGRIADKYGLYMDEHAGRPPATQIAQSFRNAMSLELVGADVIDPRSGREQQATIAFKLAFNHSNPATAQRVTNELVTLFLHENLRNRTQRAANTEAFLSAEAAVLATELAEFEAALANFKGENEGALPELQQFNLSSLERATTELNDIDARLADLAQRKLRISSELAQISPWATLVSPRGEPVLGDQERLELLRREYRQKRNVYTPGHPDIRRLEREIAGLEIAMAGDGASDTGSGRPPDNPAYIMLDAQRMALIEEEHALLSKQRAVRERADRLEQRLSRAPTVERDYQALRRGYETAQAKYQEVRTKQREAALAESLERERKGERFTLLEPPNLPLRPSRPNRPVLILAGFVVAIGAGIGMLMLMELMDNAIYGPGQLSRLTGEPPFAVVEYIENSEDIRNRSIRRRLLVGAVAGSVFATAVYAHVFIKPLDVAWFMLINRLGF